MAVLYLPAAAAAAAAAAAVAGPKFQNGFQKHVQTAVTRHN